MHRRVRCIGGDQSRLADNGATNMYYVERDKARHWLVKFSRFGGNSEIVAIFTYASSARAYARKKNLEYHGY